MPRRLGSRTVARTRTGHDVLNDERSAIRDVRNLEVAREMRFLGLTRSAGVRVRVEERPLRTVSPRSCLNRVDRPGMEA